MTIASEGALSSPDPAAFFGNGPALGGEIVLGGVAVEPSGYGSLPLGPEPGLSLAPAPAPLALASPSPDIPAGAPLAHVETDLIGSLSTQATFSLDFAAADVALAPAPAAAPAQAAAEAAPCFAAGTRILAERGEIAVEHLAAGERVVLMDGGVAPVLWVGRKLVSVAGHPKPEAVRPVTIRAGAFADGVPARDLTVSPDHGFYFDGVLIMARDLLDGISVVLAPPRPRIAYYHVELPQHAILLAEGAPAESFFGGHPRALFDNAPAQADPMPGRRRAERCAPLCEDGAALAAVRARLHARKLILGYGIATWRAPRLLVGQAMLAPAIEEETLFSFALPAGAADAVLLAPEFVPAEIDPVSSDRRRLGMGVRSVLLDGAPVSLGAIADARDLHPMAAMDTATWTRGAVRLGFGRAASSLVIGAAALPRLWGKRVSAV